MLIHAASTLPAAYHGDRSGDRLHVKTPDER
jgi:hypothetical protein